MNCKKVVTIGFVVFGMLLTGCASTDKKSNNPVEVSERSFGDDDSIAYRMGVLSGITEIYDANEVPKDSTLGGGMEGAVFGSALSLGGSLMGAATLGLAGGLLAPDAESSFYRYIYLANTQTENETIDALFENASTMFALIHNVDVEQINKKMVHKGETLVLELPYSNTGCKNVIDTFISDSFTKESQNEIFVAAKERGCVAAFSRTLIRGKVTNEQIPLVQGNKVLVSARMHFPFVSNQTLWNAHPNSDSFIYVPPVKYTYSYAKGKKLSIKTQPYPLIKGKDTEYLFVKPSA